MDRKDPTKVVAITGIVFGALLVGVAVLPSPNAARGVLAGIGFIYGWVGISKLRKMENQCPE